jgi:urease accessory protein
MISFARLRSFVAPLVAIGAVLLLTSLNVQAHPGHNVAGFMPGIGHPYSGLDHILAMIAVGLWAAQIGGRAVWAVPCTFVGAMAIGGLLGMGGILVPFVEQGILASVFLLGLMIAFAVRLPIAYTAPLVGLFAICHGYAHGAEAPESASGLTYAAGFILSTASLHACGIVLGVLMQKLLGNVMVRLSGFGIIALGCLLFSASPSEAATLDKPLKDVIDPYLAITASLASDSYKGVPENAAALNKAVSANAKNFPANLVKDAAAFAQAKDITTTRRALKPLSLSLIAYLVAQKVQTGAIYEVVCPMSGSWLQGDNKKVRNPYDASMSECGDFQRTF